MTLSPCWVLGARLDSRLSAVARFHLSFAPVPSATHTAILFHPACPPFSCALRPPTHLAIVSVCTRRKPIDPASCFRCPVGFRQLALGSRDLLLPHPRPEIRQKSSLIDIQLFDIDYLFTSLSNIQHGACHLRGRIECQPSRMDPSNDVAASCREDVPPDRPRPSSFLSPLLLTLLGSNIVRARFVIAYKYYDHRHSKLTIFSLTLISSERLSILDLRI